MSKRVQVNLSTDHSQNITVADDYTLPPLDDDWLRIDAEDGGEFVFPLRLVVNVTVEGSGG